MNKYQDALNNLGNIPFDANGGVLADYETTFTTDENGDGFVFNVRKAFANLQELIFCYEKLEKAFDKACDELNLRNKELCRLDNRFIRMCEKDWKEYLLKDGR